MTGGASRHGRAAFSRGIQARDAEVKIAGANNEKQ